MVLIFLTIIIILSCVQSHKIFLNLSNDLNISIILIIISHIFHVLLFSYLYFLEIDNMIGVDNITYLDLIYYSISTYTTLGIGDIYFIGNARLVSGVQAIVGLIMIAWSASHIYLKIKKEI